jgi:hypothetical protein
MIPRIVFALVLLAWLSSIWRGDWGPFAAWLAQIPAILRNPGPRTAYLLPYLVPFGIAYLLTLAASIFWGLRRAEMHRR